MGNMFSQGALFDAPPIEGERPVERRGTGIVHRASSAPARAPRAGRSDRWDRSDRSDDRRSGGGGAFVTTESHGNLYSSMIDFHPGREAPVDAPQVAATRVRLVEAKREPGTS